MASSSLYKGSDDLDLTCDVCQHQNKTSIAVSYCETCEEALCQTCGNVHRNQKLTRTHNLLTGDQLIDIKLEKQFRELVCSQDTSQADDCVPGRKRGTDRPSGSVRGYMIGSGGSSGSRIMGTSGTIRILGRKVGNKRDQGSVPGRLSNSDKNSDIVPSVLDLVVSDIKHYDVGCESVLSIVFMPSGHVVVACQNDGLKLLDKDFKQLSKLSLFSVCVCKVSDTEVLISQGKYEQIQFVEVLPKLVAKNVLTIGKVSAGVCYHNGEIYVVCSDKSGIGEVRVVQMDGTLVRRLGVHGETYMFTRPWDVKVNTTGNRVFVTDELNNSVTCMDMSGRVIYQYTDTDLKRPAGMLVDNQDNVLVTAYSSHNLNVIDKTGKKQKSVFGMWAPMCISYRHVDGLLAIGMCAEDRRKSLLTLKTQLACNV